MERKKLDVLVTFYNQEKYVDRAMASIFSQNCNFNFNVLIGDDGSTDGTIQAIEKWKEKYPNTIEIFSMPRKPGEKYIGGFRASQNRLNLLKNVVSEYFIFLDGDDYFSDIDKLQKQIDILDNPSNADCIGCSHNINAAYPDGTIKPYNSMTIGEGKYRIDRYWFGLYFHTDTTVVRSSVIERLPIALLENNFNDNLITYSIMQFGKLYFLPNAMAVYDQNGEGIWTGEKAVVNNIRNMFLYDLCIIINPKITFQSDVRFSSTWKKLFHLRKSIDLNALKNLQIEAQNKNLKYSLLWLEYNNNSVLKKAFLYLVFIKVILSSFLYKLACKCLKCIKNVYHRVVLAKNCIANLKFQNLWKENASGEKKTSNTSKDEKKIIHGNEIGLEIAPVFENKSGIVTIISDDGDYETSALLNRLAFDNDIPITVAGTVRNIAAHIDYWKEILGKGKIELVNHSYNHYRMDDNWKYSKKKKRLIHEIVHSRLFFERQLDIGEKVFVCPENAMCDLGYEVIEEDEVVAVRRGTRGINSLEPEQGTKSGDWLNLKCYGIMDQPEFLETRRDMRNRWLNEASSGKWLIEMWHNVDKKGYQTISCENAEEHLADICKYRDEKDLWCAKFTDAVKYLKERENAKIHSWSENGKIMVYVSCEFPDDFSLHELTISNNITGVSCNILPNKLYAIDDNSLVEESW